MASFWDYLKEGSREAVNTTSDYLVNIGKDPLGTIMTAGIKPAVDTAVQRGEKYKKANVTNPLNAQAAKSKEYEDMLSSQQAQRELADRSTLASASYGMGGSNMQSFTNKSSGKKSILGSF